MLKYIAKRILYIVFVFLMMSIVIFALYSAVPGDPAMMKVAPLKDTMTDEQFEIIYQNTRKTLGLDDPLPVRYVKWMKTVVTLDFGISSIYNRPVLEALMTPMQSTIFINIFSVLLALVITIPLGIYCAVKKFSKFDTAVQVFTIVGYSVPVFIIALVAIFFFAVKLGWFPVSGMNTPNFQGNAFEFFVDRMYYLALPLFVMTVSSLGGMTRYVRAAMIDALRMDYIRTARAKGLKERVVIYSHAWRNALLPVITLILGWFLSIFSGSIVIESVFALNGMGRVYLSALNNMDYNLAMGIQMFYIVVTLIGNLLIDLSYGIVDPRIRITK
ncbi:MAG: ABC transporter permease [Lachnospiraceae bacterium]|jgi:peptide/nickel transport system permease protein|nr:ABC transporter permease [Lachnospiraceae bacterium]